jgi:hypothetical protein
MQAGEAGEPRNQFIAFGEGIGGRERQIDLPADVRERGIGDQRIARAFDLLLFAIQRIDRAIHLLLRQRDVRIGIERLERRKIGGLRPIDGDAGNVRQRLQRFGRAQQRGDIGRGLARGIGIERPAFGIVDRGSGIRSLSAWSVSRDCASAIGAGTSAKTSAAAMIRVSDPDIRNEA